MVVAAFIFGIVILFISLCFLLLYVQSHKSMRENHGALTRQRERQLMFQAEIEARMERDARSYEAARRALVEQAGDKKPDRRNIEHAA